MIVPEVTSSGDQSNFGPGTRSGIIIYSPNVTIENLHLDGNGNAGLGGSLNYHQGITTLYDTQNGGDYSSLHNGFLPVIRLGAPVNGNRSIPAIHIDGVAVDNVAWHGITISARGGESFGESGTGLEVVNSTVDNVGGNTKTADHIGILLQNLDNSPNTPDANSISNVVSNVGVGVKTGAFGDTSYADFAKARSKAGIALTTVNDAAVRAFDIEFSDGGMSELGNVANFTDPNNNAVGLYINYGNPLINGFEINGAKIGVQIENATFAAGGGPILSFGGALHWAGHWHRRVRRHPHRELGRSTEFGQRND